MHTLCTYRKGMLASRPVFWNQVDDLELVHLL
jgi:hypothetical protein